MLRLTFREASSTTFAGGDAGHPRWVTRRQPEDSSEGSSEPVASGLGENGTMTEAAEFIDAALQRELSWYRAQDDSERLASTMQPGSTLRFYGASVGAIRGTVRDALKRYPALTNDDSTAHDEITALSSELWREGVYERRFASVVLLQSHVGLLRSSDLTRLEGFVRGARSTALVDPLASDVIAPLLARLEGADLSRAQAILRRWTADGDELLARAAQLALAPFSARPSAGSPAG
jgi:hypothetical protein